MLFLAGVIGGKTRRSAMETVKMSFGEKGGVFFSFLNVLQLVGWTAIMIYDGALAANGVLHTGRWVWCLVIGALIILWIVIGITNLGKINTVAMAALFILTLVLSGVIFGDGSVDSFYRLQDLYPFIQLLHPDPFLTLLLFWHAPSPPLFFFSGIGILDTENIPTQTLRRQT